MARLLKYIAILGIALASGTAAASSVVARSVGTQAYVAGATAASVVWVAASLALVIAFLQSRQPNKDTAVTSVLLAMLVRMALPFGAVILIGQVNRPLMEAGFFGLLTINYLLALALETVLSLRLTKEPMSTVSSTPSSSTS
ncbi:MAG: hypothetical protein GXP26_00730 [Planctomycetes bacterium]|nr:hypothetical protein [Planctomycetota bacterium]